MNPYESVWTHVPIVPGHFITLWLLILLLSLFQALRETSFFQPFCVSAIFPAKNLSEVLWWSSSACSARCQANAKASRNCSAKLKRRPEKNHETKNVQKLHTLVTLTSAWHEEPRNVRSGEIGPESFGASQIPPQDGSVGRSLNWTKKNSPETSPPRRCTWKIHSSSRRTTSFDFIFSWPQRLPEIPSIESNSQVSTSKIFDYGVARNCAPKWSDYCNTNDQCCDLEISPNGGPNFEPLPFTSIYHTCHLPTTHGFSLVALRWGNRRAAFGSRMLSCDVWPSRTRINSHATKVR